MANERPEPAETIALSEPRRDAAKTADTICRMITSSIQKGQCKERCL